MLIQAGENLFLLILFLFITLQLFQKPRHQLNLKEKILIGLIHGMFGTLSIFIAIELGNNVILDFRQMAIIFSAFFGGFPSALVTGVILGIHRLFFVNGINDISLIGTISILFQAIGLGIISLFVYRLFYKWSVMIGYSLIVSNLTFLIVLEPAMYHILTYSSAFLFLGGIIAAISYSLYQSINAKLLMNNTTSKLISTFENNEPEKAYKKILEEIMSYFNSEYGSIMVSHGSVYKIYNTFEKGEYEVTNYILKEGDVEALKIFNTGKPLLFANWNRKSPNGILEKRLSNEGIKSSTYFPVIYRSQIIACICLGSTSPYHFSNRHLSYFKNLNPIISFGFSLLESENKFMTLAQSAQDALILTDQNMRITSWNKGAENIFGYSSEEAIGQNVNIIIPVVFKNSHNQGVNRFLSEGKVRVIGKTVELQGLHKDGSVFPIELSLNQGQTGGISFFSSIIRDITERKQAQQALSESEERYRKLIELSPDGICVYQDGYLVYANDKAASQVGLDTEELIGSKSLAFLAEEYKSNMKELIDKLYKENAFFTNEEIGILKKDGTVAYFDVSASIITYNEKLAVMTTFRDVSVRKEAKRKLQEANEILRKLSYVDGLTGISNRRYFDQSLEKAWNTSFIDHTPLSLIFCDIDYFKQYNDTYGHLSGDDCLQMVAGALSAVAEEKKFLAARYGGEEFVILLPNMNNQQAIKIANQMRRQVHLLNIPHVSSLVNDIVTVSIGVATIIADKKNKQEDLIEEADKALYKAKSEGRDRIVSISKKKTLST